MPTLAEIVYNIRNAPAGGRSNRDRGFSDRQIAFAFRACRNKLLLTRYFTQSGRQRGDINPQYQQDLGIVPLTTVDIADSPNVSWGTLVKKVVIPKLVDLPRNKGLVFFGNIDKRTHIYLPDIPMGQMDEFVQYRKRDNIYASQMGDTIYLYGQDVDELCYVNIRGIFDKPQDVIQYDAQGNETCFDWYTTEYPIDTMIEEDCYEMVWQKYILMNAQLPDDNVNDEIKKTVT